MTDAAIIRATFADYRMVKGRKVLQLVCEVPVEHQEHAFGALGYPMPDGNIWVAIARLDDAAAEAEQPKEIEHRRSLAQQAGIYCNEGSFQTYMRDVQGYDCDTPEAVRLFCGVESRAELDRRPEAAMLWNELRGAYELWMRCE